MKQQTRYSTSLFVSSLACVALTGALLAGCSKEQPTAGAAGAKSGIPVAVIHPTLVTVTNIDTYPGHIEAVESVDIRPRVSGYIDSIHFTDGAEVKKGDLLFVIDPKPYQADYDKALADRQSAETRLELARNDLKRAEALKASKAISDEELDTRS